MGWKMLVYRIMAALRHCLWSGFILADRSVSEKVAPPVGLLAARSSPPCWSRIVRQIDRPIPRPVGLGGHKWLEGRLTMSLAFVAIAIAAGTDIVEPVPVIVTFPLTPLPPSAWRAPALGAQRSAALNRHRAGGPGDGVLRDIQGIGEVRGAAVLHGQRPRRIAGPDADGAGVAGRGNARRRPINRQPAVAVNARRTSSTGTSEYRCSTRSSCSAPRDRQQLDAAESPAHAENVDRRVVQRQRRERLPARCLPRSSSFLPPRRNCSRRSRCAEKFRPPSCRSG